MQMHQTPPLHPLLNDVAKPYTQNPTNVSYDGRQLALTDKEYQILLLLISHPTKTFSTQKIFESVWNEPYTQFSNNTIMVHIKNLRNKLEAGCGCAHLIKTVWGKGYKFEE